MSGFKSSGYSTKLFVEQPSDEFICGLCLDVLNNPHQCRNGHCFCYGCVCSALAIQRMCPLCKCAMSVDSMNSNLLVRNLIEKTNVRCENVGCPWTGHLHRLDGHLCNECEYRLMICTNDGCSVRVPQNQLDAHVREECPFRHITCEYCCKSFKSDDFTGHIESCELRPIVCSCNKKLLNEQLAVHLREECPMAVTPCPLHYMKCCTADCPKRMIRSQIDEHISRVTQNPLYINQLTQSLLRTTRNCEELTQKQITLESQLRDLSLVVLSMQDQLKQKADRLVVNVKHSLHHGEYVGEMRGHQRHGYGETD